MKKRGQHSRYAGQEDRAKSEIERMLKNSQTKVIMPVITLGALKGHLRTGAIIFEDHEIRKLYESAVDELKHYLGHDVHIGAKYYDAYGLRMSRYSVFKSVDHLKYKLLNPYLGCATSLCRWIPERIKEHINTRIGIVPSLKDPNIRAAISGIQAQFVSLIAEQIDRTPSNFEIFSFAVMKVHLEKFACKIYRDTRTSAHDKGVDIATNFGVVYQIKKLRIKTASEARDVYSELEVNFDNERLQNGNVILVIDEITHELRKYLVDMKVQSINKDEILKLASNFEDPEDRQKVLRIVYDEFRREYSSNIKSK